MTSQWLQWEENLLLLLRERVETEQKKSRKDWDTFLLDLLLLYEDKLKDLYWSQYMGVQWEAGMAAPLLPAEHESFLDIEVGGFTLRERLTDTVDMAAFFADADPGGRGKSVWSSVGDRLAGYVRSEGVRVMNEARYQAAKDVESELPDVVATKTWDATLDDRTRDTHTLLHGRTVGVNDYFWTANGAALYPGGFGIPQEDINCRCVIICRLNGSFKRATGKQAFEEWLAEVIGDGAERA